MAYTLAGAGEAVAAETAPHVVPSSLPMRAGGRAGPWLRRSILRRWALSGRIRVPSEEERARADALLGLRRRG